MAQGPARPSSSSWGFLPGARAQAVPGGRGHSQVTDATTSVAQVGAKPTGPKADGAKAELGTPSGGNNNSKLKGFFLITIGYTDIAENMDYHNKMQ